MTIQDLMRHTTGLTNGGRGTTAVHKLYPGSGSSLVGMTGSEVIAKLGSLPLLHQPGTAFDYSFSTDVLGLLVEAISEQTLGAFLKENLWKPLGMADTTFLIPPEKVARYAKALPNNPDTGAPQRMRDSTKPDKFDGGGGASASTAGDYVRFAQMLLNKGKLGDTQILSRKTVELMTANHLGPEIKNNVAVTSPQLAGYGFGLGVAVRTAPGLSPMPGSVGDYTWGGANGTSFFVDPKEELVVVYMAHDPGSTDIRRHYRQAISTLVYNALVD
jgi:CubicO group peptidase (beta-lactamase class C family)